MEPDSLSLSQDEFNAHMLGTVMRTTTVPGETGGEARMRCAAIVEMFRAFDPANAMESMMACHCISMQFMLSASMRDAANINLDPVMLIRARASAMAISKTLHMWVSTFQTTHKRNETRAAEAARSATTATVATPPPALNAAPLEPRPRAVQAAMPDIPAVSPGVSPAVSPGVRWPAPDAPGRSAPGIKETLLASTAALPDASPNGRLGVAPAG
jgi:hypothetical protein